MISFSYRTQSRHFLLSFCTVMAGLFIASFSWAVDGQPSFRSDSKVEYDPHTVIVRFRDGTSKSMRTQAVKGMAVKAELLSHDVRSLGLRDSVADALAVYTLAPTMTVASAIDQLKKDPAVLYAEPNFFYHLFRVPNDPDFPRLWGLRNTGQTGGTANADIRATAAWDISTGSRSVIVGIIDSGVDYTHPDLRPNMWINTREIPNNRIDDDGNGFVDDVYGYDFFDNDSDPMDENNHGTHVAGTIGAKGDNGIGVAGVNWDVRMMALKIGDGTGRVSVEAAIRAILYAVSNGAKVLNNSWGGAGESRALEDVINEAHNRGVLVVAAAGNNNTDVPAFPAVYKNVVAVAATTHNDERASFSNYGLHVDVAAPGEGIFSTIRTSSYTSYSGTSMACPHVVGLAALILSKHPEFTSDDLVGILKNTADPLNADRYIGTGRINAQRAMQVDVPFPVARLDTSGVLYGTVRIQGTARGPGFQNYVLEYSTGEAPTSWTVIFTGTVPVNNGVLFGNFETFRFPDGKGALRLTVNDTAGRHSQDLTAIDIVQLQVNTPQPYDLLRRGDVLEMRGRISAPFNRYFFEWALMSAPDVWNRSGFDVFYTSGGVSYDGILGRWTTSAMPPTTNNWGDVYLIRLVVESGQTTKTLVIPQVALESKLKAGWPRYTRTSVMDV